MGQVDVVGWLFDPPIKRPCFLCSLPSSYWGKDCFKSSCTNFNQIPMTDLFSNLNNACYSNDSLWVDYKDWFHSQLTLLKWCEVLRIKLFLFFYLFSLHFGGNKEVIKPEKIEPLELLSDSQEPLFNSSLLPLTSDIYH